MTAFAFVPRLGLMAAFVVLTAVHGGDGAGDECRLRHTAAWHAVTVTFQGPAARETDTLPNPFLDYRMVVTFTHASGAPRYRVPGYFAADGRAAETSAARG